MKILLVDDESDFTDTLLARFRQRGLDELDVVIKRSRDSAIEVLTHEDFDLVICDLRIPTVDGALDADLVHGKNVYAKTRADFPGTPLLVLSGQGDDQVVADMAELAPHDDPFATGDPKPMLQYVTKHSDLEGCLARVQAAASAYASVERVDLSPIPEHLALPSRVERVLRLFGRLRHGAVVRYQELGGGLTASRVLRVRVENREGALEALTVAKASELPEVDDEVRRFNEHVVTLTPGIFTPLMTTIRAGAGHYGGAFYSLDEGFDRSLFELIAEDHGAAAAAVRLVRDGTQRWREGRPTTRVAVSELRRGLVPDDCLTAEMRTELAGVVSWEDIERVELQVRPCPQHRDLHGLNVLVNQAGEPRMIDFGSVGPATAALDPVTLELSLCFHPSAPGLGGWPSPEDLEALANRPEYLRNCPIAPYIESCRNWAIDVGGSNADFFATAYAYAVRQLSYHDTNHAFALGIVAACGRALIS